MLVSAEVSQPAAAVRERSSTRVAVERLDVVVLHAVRPRRRQMQEAAVAPVAAVTRVLLVYGGDVTPHRRDVGERARTLGALVRAFAGVNGHVLLQVAELRERPTATIARERPNVLVQIHMHLHTMITHGNTASGK